MKKGVMSAFSGAVVLVFGLACSGMDSGGTTIELGGEELAVPASTGGGGGNQAACVRYVEHMNSLECTAAQVNVDDMCPAALDMNPIDISSYYDCMVEAAHNGEEAMSMVRRTSALGAYDVVIADIRLPDMNGYDIDE